MKEIIAVAGPTASGKSALALAICEKYGGELVSGDGTCDAVMFQI